jgi:hypothetical protein
VAEEVQPVDIELVEKLDTGGVLGVRDVRRIVPTEMSVGVDAVDRSGDEDVGNEPHVATRILVGVERGDIAALLPSAIGIECRRTRLTATPITPLTEA